jgi:flavin reductase (DIM6/NTAB) family NADH-FMN oxidoreductase RutF
MARKQVTALRPVCPSPAALVVCVDADGRPNIVTLGECFNVSVRRPVIVGIAIRTATYSYGLIRDQGEFTVNLPRASMVAAVDGIGHVSGRECNKFERFGLTPVPSLRVRPPLIAQCPLNLECRVLTEHEVGDHQLFLGEVLVEHVEEDCLDEDGRPDPGRLEMLIFAEWQYYATGPRVGRLGDAP